ncbi:MAG: nitroreductase family protein [Oscillospiraceae bacterium]|jgi:nitroreductase|nr:nitroreductase family protein [Oscillospiraceae bacterium]
MNETLNAIFTRSSCRDFDPTPLPREDLAIIAQAGAAAPSGVNAQPWHICVVADADTLAALDAEGLGNMQKAAPEFYARIQSRGGTLFYHAPAIAIVWVCDSYKPGAELLDCGIVTQNMVLAAQSLGLASCICGLANFAFAGERGVALAAKCRAPEGHRFGVSVLLGKANTLAGAHIPDEGKITLL